MGVWAEPGFGGQPRLCVHPGSREAVLPSGQGVGPGARLLRLTSWVYRVAAACPDFPTCEMGILAPEDETSSRV